MVCNTDHRFFVAHQLEELGVENASIILEPMGRNTAPATAIAALHAMESGTTDEANDPILLILPADHVIHDIAAFHQILQHGEQLAEEDHMVTFGIVPSGPETGYGYIKGGAGLDHDAGAMQIERFVENPIKQQQKTISRQEIPSGTAACSCFVHPVFSKSWKHSHLIC